MTDWKLSILEPDWFFLYDVSEVPTSIFRHGEKCPHGDLYKNQRPLTVVFTMVRLLPILYKSPRGYFSPCLKIEVGTSETSHNKNQPGSRIDNFQTVITNTEPTNQRSIFPKIWYK